MKNRYFAALALAGLVSFAACGGDEAETEGTLVEDGASPSVTSSMRTPGVNGNNVDLATETMNAMQATFRYQLLTRAVGDRASLITTAIGGM